jgi:sporulation protein YlmC with PRC-barrel domain
MEGKDKPLTRDALISMQVIDAKGKALGKVKEVSFAVGKTGISLIVESNEGQIQDVSWEEVQAASDFIILKPTAQSNYQAINKPQESTIQASAPVQTQPSQPLCLTCGKPLTWIPQYQRWYCYNDKKYA